MSKRKFKVTNNIKSPCNKNQVSKKMGEALQQLCRETYSQMMSKRIKRGLKMKKNEKK